MGVQNTSRPWSCIETYHEAEYKQLPIDPDRAKLAMAALRRLGTGTWLAFRPRPLFFGAETAAKHYTFAPCSLGVLVSRIFGIRLATYFGDIGSLSPSDLGKLELDTIKIFLIAGSIPKKGQGRPGPGNGVPRPAMGLRGHRRWNDHRTLPARWRKKEVGRYDPKNPGMGGHPPGPTGKPDWAIVIPADLPLGALRQSDVSPLHTKLNAQFYRPLISGRGKRV